MHQTYLKILLVLMAALPVGYYLYVGLRAYSIERRDFLPVPYDSLGGKAALEQILLHSEQVTWALSGNGMQQAYYLPPNGGATLVYLHGSPGNGAGFHPFVAELAHHGLGALVIDLPGYGASEGERNWGEHYDQSVLAGLEFLISQNEVDANRIAVLGYSQGANIAARAAAGDDRFGAIIILAGYTNLYDQLNSQFRWRIPGIGLFAVAAARAAGVELERMDSVAALEQVPHKPLLVISGTNDHVIPVEMAETLATTSENAELWLLEGAGHVNIVQAAGDALFRRIAEFSESALKPGQGRTGRTETIGGPV